MSQSANSVVAEIDELEDKLDAAQALLAFLDTAREETFPSAVIGRLMNGDNPVSVYRDHRGLTTAELATLSGVDPEDLAACEGGVELGLRPMQRIARALGVDLDDLVPWSQG